MAGEERQLRRSGACPRSLILLPSTIQAPITTEAVDALLEYGQQVRGPCQNRAGSAFGQPARRRLVSAPDHVPEAAPGFGQPRPTRLLGPALARTHRALVSRQVLDRGEP